MRARLRGLLACVALTALTAVNAIAQEYPVKPIRIIVGYTSGGGNDLVARLLAPKMSGGLGQPVIIENKPGAQSIIAAEYVAKSPPDGYTILIGPSGPMTMNPATYAKLPYSPLRDFAPVSLIGSFPLILAVSSSLPVGSATQLIQYAKARPDSVNYAASAAPFQLATELFKQKTGTRFQHIPYKGSGDSAKAVISGEVTMLIADPPAITGPIRNGQLRALAITSAHRHPSYPNVPTMGEAGIPDMEIHIWTGFFVPAGTPPAIVNRLQHEVARVLRLPDIQERLRGLGIDPVSSTSEELREIVAHDIERWTAVAKSANITND